MRHSIAMASILAVAAGCVRGDSEASSSKASSENVELRILSWKETEQLVASHRGKVVVLDLWSTACVPCLKELPRLVDLHRKSDPDRLACISASCDYAGMKDEPPEALREPVLAVLRKMGASFQNVLLNVPSDELFAGLRLGSIPAVFVYGPDGTLARRFDNDAGLYGEESFSYEKHILPLVEELLVRR